MPERGSATGSDARVSASRRRLASVGDLEELKDSALRLFASTLIDLALSLIEEAEEEKEAAA
ncbi:MAG TPA: hypothetical protein VI541_05500 [Actinomycetota bacterium]|nr:hypothetical protein [Actinomycetota bacterium]